MADLENDDSAELRFVDHLARVADPIKFEKIVVDGVEITLGAVYQGLDHGYQVINFEPIVEQFRDRPRSIKGAATALTLASFIELVNRHKDDSSAVFANILSPSPYLTAVIDYHELDHEPRFGRHGINYSFPLSDEWKAWRDVNAKPLSQEIFSAWLEDHLPDLATATAQEKEEIEPKLQIEFGTPIQIATLSRGLTVHVSSVVSELTVLQSGAGSVRFEESHNGADGKPLKIPGLFIINIPLFVGSEAVRIPVRLRYRKAGASISWSFHLFRFEYYVREALKLDLATVEQETELPVYEGAPEA